MGASTPRSSSRMDKRLDWSRPLPRAWLSPEVMTLVTLADVRELMRHLPDAPGPSDLAPRCCELDRRPPAPTRPTCRSCCAWRS